MGDQSVDETISQSTLLSKGNYEFGFDYYLTANGLAQVNNSKLKVTVIGTTIYRDDNHRRIDGAALDPYFRRGQYRDSGLL